MYSIIGSANWHNLDWQETARILGTDVKRGLSEDEAKNRQKEFGRNLLPKEKPLSKLLILLGQFKSPLIYILVIAGFICLFLKSIADAVVIFGAVFINTIVGYIQEYKASNALKELKKAVRAEAEVVRDGNTKMIDSEDVIPGDIIILKAGDKVPADARVFESYELKTNEMALSGEWLPADKKISSLAIETPLADRDNMVYTGTVVEYGKAKAIAVAIGSETEMGKVAKMVKETKEGKTPLQKKISYFSKIISAVIFLICILILIEGILTGNDFLEIFTVSIAVAVAAIPEGLPIAMTVILAIGMHRILKKKGLVRKLLAAETLGGTSIICTDKTRTLTEGKMMVSEVIAGAQFFNKNDANKLLVLKMAALNNEAFIENPEETTKKWIIQGRPTDKALLLAGMEAGFNKKELEKQLLPVAEVPFDSKEKYMARAFEINKREDIIYVSGAPEKILKMSKYVIFSSKEKLLNKKSRKEIEDKINGLAKKGLRIIGFSYKKVKNVRDLFNDLVFVGLIALKDPIRKEAKGAIEASRKAGMKPIIVTGDHKLTAKVVAEELGFKINGNNIIEGKDLDILSDKELKERLKEIEIYARVEPRHKMRIIEAWQDQGEIVAMTGDGINDTPALKKADIGIALGSGTEVAKGASDLVLLSDNFNVIVAAIKEGRKIIDNVRKVITYLLSDSFTETILVSGALFFGYPLPITAVQILWVNIVEDGLPDLALAFEPAEKDVMKLKPEDYKKELLTKEMKILIFLIGLVTDIILLGLFFVLFNYSGYEIGHIRSVIFAALTIDSLFTVFSLKSLRKNIWQIDIFSNKLLVFSWIFGVLMILSALYIPVLNSFLKTQPLNFYDMVFVFSLGIIHLFLVEMTKWLFIVKPDRIK
ncbi:MAG: HAD-IC family P-type ATPase [Candidatus Pacebacteria bacterium]|nr:HAD-IC family P-type ATPase [Candidatus Paceibacterota bacterium]